MNTYLAKYIESITHEIMADRFGINWKLFFLLLVASVVTSILVLPYALALSPAISRVFSTRILVAQLIQTTVEFSIAIFVGLYLAKKVGFSLPLLESWMIRSRQAAGGEHLKSILGISFGMGVFASILIVAFGFLYVPLPTLIEGAGLSIPLWQGFLASFYGGIGEEILFRLFLMTLLVWISFKTCRASDGEPTSVGI